MTSQQLMQAVGAASVAVSIIDNGGADPNEVLAKVRDALTAGFNGQPVIRMQVCPARIHRDWWADGENLDCPWCDADGLRAELEAVGERPVAWSPPASLRLPRAGEPS